jgi:hypothetical protein
MSEKMRVCISSPPDRERLVLSLEIYPERSGEYWLLDFEDVVDILVEAKRRIVGEKAIA